MIRNYGSGITSKIHTYKKCSAFAEHFSVAETEQISKHFLEDLERLTSLSAEAIVMEY